MKGQDFNVPTILCCSLWMARVIQVKQDSIWLAKFSCIILKPNCGNLQQRLLWSTLSKYTQPLCHSHENIRATNIVSPWSTKVVGTIQQRVCEIRLSDNFRATWIAFWTLSSLLLWPKEELLSHLYLILIMKSWVNEEMNTRGGRFF